MSNGPVTAVELNYLFDDGSKGDLGRGEIDAQGHIRATEPAEGQEGYVAEVLEELNARENVILKEAPKGDEHGRFGIQKRKVPRGDRGFLSALKAYCKRIYGIELVFDESALLPPEDEPLEQAEYGAGDDPGFETRGESDEAVTPAASESSA
jgi:hypothetical protein